MYTDSSLEASNTASVDVAEVDFVVVGIAPIIQARFALPLSSRKPSMHYLRAIKFFALLIIVGSATGYTLVRADIVPLDPTSERWKKEYEPYLASVIDVNDIATLVVMYKGKREVVRMKYVASRAELEARQGQPIKTIQVDSADIDRALHCRPLIINHLRSIIVPHQEKVLLRMAEPARDGVGRLVVNDVDLLTPTTRLDGTPGYIFYSIPEWHLMGEGFALPIPDRWNNKWKAENYFIPGRLDLYEGCKKSKRGIFSTWVDELLKESEPTENSKERLKCTIPLESATAWPRWRETGPPANVYFAQARVVLEAKTPESSEILCQHADNINQELQRLLEEADDELLQSNEVATVFAEKLHSYVKRKLTRDNNSDALNSLRVVEFEIRLRNENQSGSEGSPSDSSN